MNTSLWMSIQLYFFSICMLVTEVLWGVSNIWLCFFIIGNLVNRSFFGITQNDSSLIVFSMCILVNTIFVQWVSKMFYFLIFIIINQCLFMFLNIYYMFFLVQDTKFIVYWGVLRFVLCVFIFNLYYFLTVSL